MSRRHNLEAWIIEEQLFSLDSSPQLLGLFIGSVQFWLFRLCSELLRLRRFKPHLLPCPFSEVAIRCLFTWL